jgi:DNA-binding NtrC family response regulator
MGTILLIGQDEALLEGLAQAFAAAGYSPHLAHTAQEGVELAVMHPPLALIVERQIAINEPEVLRLPLANAGALVVYRSNDADLAPLPTSLQRFVLADLTLPLERHRLFALVQRVAERARTTGRRQTPPPEPRV